MSEINKNRTFVSKGWGYEDWIINTEKYCGKILFFKKGKKCSWHVHKLKDECFLIMKGKLKVAWSDDDNINSPEDANCIILEEGDSFHIPAGRKHQMTGLFDTTIIEFSTQHFDSDSYRIQKGD